MSIFNAIFYFVLPLMISMVHFSVCTSNGAGEGTVKRGTPMKAALIFAISSFLLLWAGYYIASLVEGRVAYTANAVAFFFLAIIGFRMVFHGWQKKAQKKIFNINEVPVIFALALALGMNILFMGVALYFLDVRTMRFSLILAFVILLVSFSGLLFGNQFSEKTGWKLELTGGIFIIANGFWLLVI